MWNFAVARTSKIQNLLVTRVYSMVTAATVDYNQQTNRYVDSENLKLMNIIKLDSKCLKINSSFGLTAGENVKCLFVNNCGSLKLLY